MMNEKQFKALATELAKHLKTPECLNQPRKTKNSRNGYRSKTLLCDEGELDITILRNRDSA